MSSGTTTAGRAALRARTLHMRLLRCLTVPVTCAALAIAGLVALPQLARAATGPFLYLADGRNNAVDVVDASDGAGVATIPVGVSPADVVLNPAGTEAYVANPGSGTVNGPENGSVSVIDTSTNIVTATIPLGSYHPDGIAINPAGTLAYASAITSTGAGAIVVINTSTDTVTGTIPCGAGGGIALNPAGTVAYVSDETDDELAVVDLSSGAVTASVPTGARGAPASVAVSPDGSRVYVLDDSPVGSAVSVFDTSTNTLAAVIPTESWAANFALNPAGTLIYVAGLQGDISVIDTTTETLTGTIPLYASGGVAFGADGTVAYAGTGYEGGNPDASVAVIDTATSAVTATISLGGNQAIESIAVMPAAEPTATSLTVSPSGTAVQGNTVTLSATETPAAAGTVQFFDGTSPLGQPVPANGGTATYTTSSLALGSHSLTAVFTPSSATFTGSSSQPVQLQVIPPPFDQAVTVTGTGTVTTAPFSTAEAGETLLAFVGSDGPFGAHKQTVTVSGVGLTWTQVTRANAQAGDAEIWQAAAPSVLTGATVTSKQAKRGYDQDLTVVAVQGTSGVGASGAASARSGAPALSLTTTGDNSLVFAAGDDWDNAIARTLPAGWTMLNQWLDTRTADTFWSQYTSAPIVQAGTVVSVGDTAPTTDRWNLAAVEVTSSTG